MLLTLRLCVKPAEFAVLVILDRLNNLFAGRHHERAMGVDGLIDHLAVAKQQARVATGFDVEAVTVAIDFNEMVRLNGLTAHLYVSIHHVEKHLPPWRDGQLFLATRRQP